MVTIPVMHVGMIICFDCGLLFHSNFQFYMNQLILCYQQLMKFHIVPNFDGFRNTSRGRWSQIMGSSTSSITMFSCPKVGNIFRTRSQSLHQLSTKFYMVSLCLWRAFAEPVKDLFCTGIV